MFEDQRGAQIKYNQEGGGIHDESSSSDLLNAFSLHGCASLAQQNIAYCVTDPVTGLKLSMGPIRARIAYTRAMSEHRCFPKRDLSTHTMHFK